MRKALILLLAVFIIVSVCFGMAVPMVNEGRDDVVWTEETLVGHRSAIEGLHIQTQNVYYRSLLWTSEAVLGENPEPVTDFRFSNGEFEAEYENDSSGIILELANDFNSYANGLEDHIDEYVAEKYQPLLKKLMDNYNSAPLNVETAFSVDLKEYLDYYPLSGMIHLPGITWPFLDILQDHLYADEGSAELAKKINDYFRIPIQGSYVMEYSINKYESGTSMSISYSTNIFLNSASVVTEDTCYMAFNVLQEDGSVLDTSLIPGGYGIYAIDLVTGEDGSQTPVSDTLRTVFAMDPYELFIDMELTHDGQRILMQTEKNGDLMLTVIELETMTTLQKLCLQADWAEFDQTLRLEDGYICLLSEDPNRYDSMRITVYEEQEDHTFSRAMDVNPTDPRLTELDWSDMLRWYFEDCSVAYNGETLVIAQTALEPNNFYYAGYSQDGCDFLIAAYDDSGMVYAGRYHVNLTDVYFNINRFSEYSPIIWW